MKRELNIYGCVIDQDVDSWSNDDVSPKAFKDSIEGLNSGDELVLSVNSCGGSVTGGIAIANMIKALARNGVKTTAKIEGIAASIASVIVCACENVIMPKSAFMMIHNCWSLVQGNSDDLRKEADTMDKMNDAIISFYLGKFSKSADELKQLMDEETWFSGNEAVDFGFNCEVVDDDKEYKVAACLTKTNFKNIPNGLIMKNEIVEKDEDEKKEEEEETQPTEGEEKKEEEPVEEEVVEEEKEEPVEEEEKKEEEEDDEQVEDEDKENKCGEDDDKKDEVITKAECEKRVSGMQSVMAKKLDALKVEHAAQIEDFKNQLKLKDEELIKANAEITSLKDSLDNSAKELLEVKGNLDQATSALVEKTNALATLNAGVNVPKDNESKKDTWKSLRGDEFFAWLKEYTQTKKSK